MRTRAAPILFAAALAATAACGSSGAVPAGARDATNTIDAALDHVESAANVVSVVRDGATLDMAAAPDAAGRDGASTKDAGAADGSPDAPDASKATDASGDGFVITPDLCTQKCELMAQIDCPGSLTLDDCISGCIGDGANCVAEKLAYYQCLLAEGTPALMCDPSLQAVVLKDGFCTQQNEDFFNCP